MFSIVNNYFNNIPNNKAIICCNCNVIEGFLTFNSVRELTELIFNFISKNVKEKSTCIGLLMDHNIYIPPIILSLEKLNHSFIFLKFGPKNYQTVLEDLSINWILTFNSTNDFMIKDKLFLKSKTDELFLLESNKPHRTDTELDNVFCVVLTSGTTGKHKYVKVLHECIYKNVDSLSRKFKITQDDVIYYGTPLTFDPSLIELLLALRNGACLLFSSNKTNPNNFYKTITSNNVTVLQIVPSLFTRWSQQQIQDILLNSKLKVLALGGEPFPKEILNYNKSSILHIYNLYGITEVSCWATVYEIKGNETEIPLGEELDETIIELRNELGQTIVEGEGEIFIGSYSRICYINDEMPKSRPVFRATGDLGRKADKQLFYLTRRDNVVKRFGQRIDLLKIEELISDLINLDNKCVWFEAKSKLLTFIKIKDFSNKIRETRILDKIRIKLLNSLTNYYFPDYFGVVREFPLTSHGKIDKGCLKNIYLNKEKSSNANPVELFKLLFCKYFGLNFDESINRNFFEIGGNSILAIQFLSEFQDELGVEYPTELVSLLFEKDMRSCLNCLNNFIPQQTKRLLENDELKINLIENKKVKTNIIELQIAWTYNFDACVDSPPLVFKNLRNEILVALGSFSHKFAVINAKTGQEIAHFTLPEAIESMVCLSACKYLLYVACFDGKLYCIDYVNKRIIWTYPTADRIKSTPCLCQNKLVFGSYDKHLHCVDANSGEYVWKQFLSESISSNPLYIDSKKTIYIATIFGNCFCLTVSKGEIIWSYKTGNPIFGSPCTDSSNNCIIWPDVQGFLHCLSLDGQLLWKYQVNGNIYSSLKNYGNYLIFGCHDHNLYVLKISRQTPKVHRLIKFNSAITSTPFIVCDDKSRTLIVVASNSGLISLIEFASGDVLGEIMLPGEIFSSPNVFEEKIYVGCRDNNLYCINFGVCQH